MTGHRSDETHDAPQENHSDAESLRHIPASYMERGVVQDGPGTRDIGVEHTGDPNRQMDDSDDDTNGATLDDDLTAKG